jgi:hypothetical protein
MRKLDVILATVLGVALQAACTPIGDGAMIVRGQAMDPAAELYRICLLDTRDAAGTVVDRQTVPGTFEEIVFIAPRTADYSFAISCQGADETYQSPTFRVGPSDRYENPIDLGRVVLKRP